MAEITNENQAWEAVAGGLLITSLDLMKQFKPMNLDRDNSAGAGGGPDDEDAQNRSPIKPIKF